jgi:ribosomal protein S18 acetylase RimI-like enzyme
VTVEVRVLDPQQAEQAAPSVLQLLVEFTPAAAALTAETVAARLRTDDVHVVTAERDGQLLGMATLCVYATLTTGTVGQVEDVIVTEAARGERLGVRLMQELQAEAARLGCAYLQLTSRPSREAANRLYRSLGYTQRETNVYRLRLPTPTDQADG